MPLLKGTFSVIQTVFSNKVVQCSFKILCQVLIQFNNENKHGIISEVHQNFSGYNDKNG